MAHGTLKPIISKKDPTKKTVGRLAYRFDGHKRLAAAVMLRAVQDFVIWRSPIAVRYRAASIAGDRPTMTTLSKKLGQNVACVSGPDPALWLCVDTEFHALLEIEAESMHRVLSRPERLIELLSKGAGD